MLASMNWPESLVAIVGIICVTSAVVTSLKRK